MRPLSNTRPGQLRCPGTKPGKKTRTAAEPTWQKHNLIAFVDSDSFLNRMRSETSSSRFRIPKWAASAADGCCQHVYKRHNENAGVRYYIAFRIMKAAEAFFDSVTCLSGPLSCYRKDILLKKYGYLAQSTVPGRRATFGDDRAMTNLILRNYRTGYQDTAICSTIVRIPINNF